MRVCFISYLLIYIFAIIPQLIQETQIQDNLTVADYFSVSLLVQKGAHSFTICTSISATVYTLTAVNNCIPQQLRIIIHLNSRVDSHTST